MGFAHTYNGCPPCALSANNGSPKKLIESLPNKYTWSRYTRPPKTAPSATEPSADIIESHVWATRQKTKVNNKMVEKSMLSGMRTFHSGSFWPSSFNSSRKLRMDAIV